LGYKEMRIVMDADSFNIDYVKFIYSGKTYANLTLEQNYPNPFSHTTIIPYYIPDNSFVTIKIFDMLGREVKTLVKGQQSPGYYRSVLDGSKLASGIYIYQLKVDNSVTAKKLVLVK
jgi:hypothetical protein